MRLIDADAIDYDEFWNRNGEGFSIIVCQKAQQIIDEQPTIEPSGEPLDIFARMYRAEREFARVGDLISRAEAIKILQAKQKYFDGTALEDRIRKSAYIDAEEVISYLQSVSAERVVYCKDCIYGHQQHKYKDIIFYACNFNKKALFMEDFFCANGELKEKNQ